MFYAIGKFLIESTGSIWDKNKEYVVMKIEILDSYGEMLEIKHFYVDGDIEDIIKNMTEEEISWIYENPKNTKIKVLHNGKLKVENKEGFNDMINFKNMTSYDKARVENSIWILLQYKDEITDILADNEWDHYDFINMLQDIKEAMEK